MAIQNDFEELRSAWSRLSLLGKIFFGGSFLVSVSSIASIADIAFKFRGFIVYAIEFYRMTTMPIMETLHSWTGIKLEQFQVDLFVYLALITFCFVRAQWLKKQPCDYKFHYSLWHLAIILILFSSNKFTPSVYQVAAVFIFVVGLPLIPIIAPFITQKHGQYKQSETWKVDRQIAKLAVLNIVAVLLFVAIIAGISDGLTRAI
jgi:hypothetical protein